MTILSSHPAVQGATLWLAFTVGAHRGKARTEVFSSEVMCDRPSLVRSFVESRTHGIVVARNLLCRSYKFRTIFLTLILQQLTLCTSCVRN
jgi:hypothetical protein